MQEMSWLCQQGLLGQATKTSSSNQTQKQRPSRLKIRKDSPWESGIVWVLVSFFQLCKWKSCAGESLQHSNFGSQGFSAKSEWEPQSIASKPLSEAFQTRIRQLPKSCFIGEAIRQLVTWTDWMHVMKSWTRPPFARSIATPKLQIFLIAK